MLLAGDRPEVRVDDNQLGISSIAHAFGAKIHLNVPNQGVYLIFGRDNSLSGLVRAAGGCVTIKLPQNKVLATLPVEAFLTFRQHSAIAFIGPVSVDRERFAQFVAGINQGQTPNSP